MSNKIKLNIVFYVNGLPFDGNTLKEKAIGGSETQGIQLSSALAVRGHNVVVFSNCQESGSYDGVRYIPMGKDSSAFVNYMKLASADVLIAQRIPDVFGREFNSKLNILWCHDLSINRGINAFRSSLWNIDEVWGLSDFHINQMAEVNSVPKELFWKTRNALDLSLVNIDKSIKRQKKRLIYTGRPERGTDLLLELMPKIWEKDPEVEIYFAGYDCPNPSIQPFYDSLIRRMQELGDKVKWLGALTKEELYKHYQEASLYIYLTDFEDTYCLANSECMANGLPIIATPKGALPETMHPDAGMFVGSGEDGEARKPEYQERFAAAVIKLLNDPERLNKMSKVGIEHAKTLSVEALVEEWETHIYELFAQRTENKEALAKHFYRTDDVAALYHLNIPKWNRLINKDGKHLTSKRAYKELYDKKGLKEYEKILEIKEKTPEISIVIPTVRGEAARKVVENLHKKGNRNHEYIIIENGESGKFPIKEKEKLNIKIISNKENVGFTKAVNQGIKESTKDYIAIVNDDIYSYANWDYALTSLMEEKNIHYLSPNANNTQHEEAVFEEFYSSFMVITRELIDKVGVFDEQFFLVFQDVDFQERMRDAGYLCYVARDTKAVHQHSQSRKVLGLEFDNTWEDIDHGKFLEKWKDRPDILEKHPKIPAKIRNKIKEKTFKEIAGDFIDKEYEKQNFGRCKLAVNFFRESGTKNILDYGSGIGNGAAVFYNELPTNVTCVNISKDEQKVAKDYIKKTCALDDRNIEFLSAESPKDLIKHKGKWDGVYCGEVLEHYPNPKLFVDELEALVPDGTLMVFTFPIPEYMNYKHGQSDMTHLWNLEKADIMDLFGKKSEFITRIVGNIAPPDKACEGGYYRWHVVRYVKTSSKNYCPVCKESKIEVNKCFHCSSKLELPITGKINMDRKLSIQTPKQTLSVCMITENSEDLLHRTLKSVQGLADEIIVYDANSTDSTREILAKYTDKVYDAVTPLKIGFNEARNRTLEHATGDWILWIDSDESLLTPFNLFKYLRYNIYNGYSIRQHHFSAQPPNVFQPDLPVRVFRNNKGIKWEGFCHEHPEISVNEGVGQSVILHDIDIAHDGYLSEYTRRKRFHRNFRLLEKAMQKQPERNLTRFLYIRDMIHWARYSIENSGGQITQEAQKYCQIALDMYKNDFLGKPHLISNSGIEYYSEALTILNRGLEYKFCLNVAPHNTDTPQIQTIRFETPEDFQKYINAELETKTKFFTGKYA